MYDKRAKQDALDLWFSMPGEMSVDDFAAELGYPSGSTLRNWIKADPRHDPDKCQYRSKPVLPKLEAIRRVAEGATAAQGALDRGVVEVRGPDLNLQRRGALGVPGRDRPARDLPSAELREPDRHRDVLCAERGQPPRGVRGPHDCPLSGSPSPSAASASRSFMR